MHSIWTLALEFKNQEWSGEGTFFDGQSAHAASVQVTIKEFGISMLRDGVEYSYSKQNLLITERTNSYVRIELQSLKGSTLVLNDVESIETLIANGFIKKGFLSSVSTKIKLPYLVGLFVLLVVLFFSFGLDFIVESSLDLISEENEAALGRKVFGEIAKSQTLATDPELIQVLEKCATVVQKFDSTRTFEINISIIEDAETKNAFALPGGHIVIYRAKYKHN